MKLIFVIVSSEDANQLQTNLNEKNLFNIRLSTQSGFFTEEHAIFAISIKEEKMEETLEIIKKNSKTKKQLIPPGNILKEFDAYYSLNSDNTPSEISVGGAVVFILNLEKFFKL